MAALTLTKGHVRLRKMQDNSNEYVLPCHPENISAMRLSDSGKYLVTACEGGMYIRVWGWYEGSDGHMEAPVSLYMLEIPGRNEQVIDLQLSKNMRTIVASLLLKEDKQ